MAVYNRWRFTRLVCWLLAIHAIVLMVGGHYTYAEVPLFNWIRDAWHLDRNYYDRVGHFLQGFRARHDRSRNPDPPWVVKRGAWLNFIVISICLAFSACYELLEWQAAVWTGEKADSFLGTQGDPWDTQWDMDAGALRRHFSPFLSLGKVHDEQLRTVSVQVP